MFQYQATRAGMKDMMMNVTSGHLELTWFKMAAAATVQSLQIKTTVLLPVVQMCG